MRKIQNRSYHLLLLLLVVLVYGCDSPEKTSLFDPNYEPERPQPEISEIYPAEGYLAGLEGIQIFGDNYVMNETFVYFDDRRADIMNMDIDAITVRAPNVTGDSVRVRVSVLKNDKYSETRYYPMEQGVSMIEGFDENTYEAFGMATDSDNNIYTSLMISDTNEGIYKFDQDGQASPYAAFPDYTLRSLLFGPDGYLYFLRGGSLSNFVGRFPPGGGNPEVFVSGLSRLEDMDFDKNGNLWTGGLNMGRPTNNIYRIDPDGDIVTFTLDADIDAIRVFDDHLFIAGSKANAQADIILGVWQIPIHADGTLGSDEEYFNVSGILGGEVTGVTRLRAITFSEDGDLFIGTNGNVAILRVEPDGSWSTFYKDVINPSVYGFAWEKGTQNLLMAKSPGDGSDERTILRINTLKDGAPYYGVE